MKVEVECKDGIGWITLKQPKRHNAIDTVMIQVLKTSLNELKLNDDIRLLVIRGEGTKAFCSGGDLSVFQRLHTEKEAYKMLSNMGRVLYDLFIFPKPTIALLNGVAVGGGCELAAACDFRIALPHIKFGFIQGKLGITTGWGGTTYLMERIQPEIALELLMSAEKYTAVEGVKFGFIHRVLSNVNSMNEFDHWLGTLSRHAPQVLQAYKQRRLDRLDLVRIKDQIEKEIRECSKLWEMEDHHQAVRAFLHKS